MQWGGWDRMDIEHIYMDRYPSNGCIVTHVWYCTTHVSGGIANPRKPTWCLDSRPYFRLRFETQLRRRARHFSLEIPFAHTALNLFFFSSFAKQCIARQNINVTTLSKTLFAAHRPCSCADSYSIYIAKLADRVPLEAEG